MSQVATIHTEKVEHNDDQPGQRIALPIPKGWYCIGYSDEVQVGDVITLRYFSRDMVMYRGQSGDMTLVEPFCPHLGAHLGKGGQVVGDDIQCPFHAWRFNSRGECTDVPYASKIPPKAANKKCLTTYPVREVNGIIWSWYHPDNTEPEWEVHSFEEIESGEWDAYQKREWTIKTHIQESGENAVDSAHFLYVHKMDEITSKPEIVFEDHKRTSALHFIVPLVDEKGGQRDDVSIEGSVVTACVGPGQTWTKQEGVGMGDLLVIGLPTPIEQNVLHLRFASTVPLRQKEKHGLISQGLIDHYAIQVEQDISIWENKIYQDDPILCDGDGPIAKYRSWFKQFYQFT